jgi:phytanoyl-CoA hydroxylase
LAACENHQKNNQINLDNTTLLSKEQVCQFQQEGYLVLRQHVDTVMCEEMIAFTQRQLNTHAMPIEYEADIQYPGAPASRDAEGGLTARRVLQAVGRNPTMKKWATNNSLVRTLRQLLGNGLYLVQSHHNCIMTKQPQFSSETGWHRDSRFWNFQRAELVSAWLALRDETIENGCLLVIPGSHRLLIDAKRMDKALFFRTDLSVNQSLLRQAKPVPLLQGDVLLFHSNLFHAAGCNQTTQTKFSLVTTYRAANNPPFVGSRSASLDEILL